MSAKRSCPLASHAISATEDGVPLLKNYESEYGVKITNKKQKVCAFMQSKYNVERIGQSPSYKVTLYSPPRVDAALAVTGGAIKLGLSVHGYQAVTTSKDNFMGFFVR